MTVFHRLGEPFRQPGIPGVIFPVEFSDGDEPFTPFLSTSIIVSGVVQGDELVIDEAELDAMLAKLEDDIAVQRAPIAPRVSVAGRIGVVQARAKGKPKKAR